MKIPLTFMLLLLAISFSSMKCEKEETDKTEKLPEETQTGKQTFGCLVNGEVWLPRANFPYAGLTATIQYDILDLVARQGNKTSLGIVIRELNSVGEYSLSGQKIYASYGSADHSYYAKEGKIVITKYDKINQVLSGKFYFTAKDSLGSSVVIKDGRFDLKYTN